MAETAASALLNVIFQKLADEAFKKYARSQNIHSELKQLGITLTQIQALLNDASHKETTHESVRLWLNSLQHLAYDIDDVLDEVATEAMHRELTRESEASTSMVRKLLIPTCCTNFSLSHRLSPKLDSINTQLQHLEKQKSDLGLIVKDEKQKNINRGKETSLLESYVIGRESEKQKLLIKLLQDEASTENFSIVPIVGMGGVGKTTLARLLYNEAQVKDHFEVQAWVCVSDDFDIYKISKIMFQAVSWENKEFEDFNQLQGALIDQLKDKRFVYGEKKEFEDLNQLQMALAKQLKDRRFLLVLDDMWNLNYGDWENLVRPFQFSAPGSRIIVTTRKDQLLKKLGFDHLDRLEIFSHEDALSLFALHALGVDNFNLHATLKPQGEGIVKKCGGLPLALKAIGRLLRTNIDGEYWNEVLNSEIWDLENADEIVPALRLSYHDLSADLKQLFAYCSLFPKDFLFDKEELVLLWMAEGYLNRPPANKSPERLGHEYFEKLLSRSFFQHAPNDKSLFMMHDLMNDLATYVAGNSFLRFDKQMEMAEEDLAKYRHMSFIREEYVVYRKFEAFKRAKNLRSFLAVYVGVDQSSNQFYLSSKILVDLLPQLPLLRVLCLSRFEISVVPDFIGSLKHLRYFNLSQTQIKELPNNMGNLYNLQTLIVFGCRNLTKLPKSFSKLKELRHFDIRDTPLLKNLPLGIGELRSLKTLTKIILGGDSGFAITKLKGLTNLQGEISIEGLHQVQSMMHAREANLCLKRLTKLELKWGDGSPRETLEKEVLNELKPHIDKLKILGIECYMGIEFPNWVGDPSFHDLVHVSIRGCRKCTSLPPFGQLPSLKEMFIQGMDKVKVIGLEFIGTTIVGFPSLEILGFEDMSGWEVWSTDGKVVFPSLRELQIKSCPNLIDISLEALSSLRILTIDGCGDGVLRSLAQVASSIAKVEIRSIPELTYEVWMSVLKYLGEVEEVSIERCKRIRHLWESEEQASKVLVNIKKLNVRYCENLVSLGEKEKDNSVSNLLSSLRMLDVSGCESMVRCYCPSNIESLSIYVCESITCVSFPMEMETGGGQKLKSLTLCECEKLMEKINNTNMPMLEDVYIYGWSNLRSISQLSNSIHLTLLSIKDCPSLESFPDIELSNLTLLKRLNITKCPSIDASFPRGHWPPNLVTLGIGGLKKPISEWGPQNFPTSLVDLRLFGEAHVSNFGLLSSLLPSSLIKFRIEEFDNLESLSMGLQHLTSLQHLSFNKCPEMIHLPETLLPSLLSLTISECPKLEERCEGRGSHYWPRISHIPKIQIDFRDI